MNTHRLWDDNDKAHKGQKTRAQLVDKLFNDTSRENINYIICLLLSRFIMYVHKYLKVLSINIIKKLDIYHLNEEMLTR